MKDLFGLEGIYSRHTLPSTGCCIALPAQNIFICMFPSSGFVTLLQHILHIYIRNK